MSVVYILVGIKLFKQNKENRINYFSFFMFAAAIYSLGYFLELNCISIDTLLLVRNFEFIGAILLPTFVILFVAQLTKFEVKKKVMGILFAVSAMLWLIFITNSHHSLFYRSLSILVNEYCITLTKKGPAAYLFMLYGVIILISSNRMLLKVYKMAEKNRKDSIFFVFVTFQVPWFALLIILLGFDTYIDPLPATIMVMGVLFAVNEIKNDIFELQINRWKRTFSDIGEPAFLVNEVCEIF